MPELPEVETVVRGLRERIIGEVITAVEIYWPRTVAGHAPADLAAGLVGAAVTGVSRRGKYAVISLGERGCLLVHLRMTGRLLVEEPDEPEVRPSAEGADTDPPAWEGPAGLARHTRVLWRFASGRRLRFWDLRKFGRVLWAPTPNEALAALGPEPLAPDLTPAILGEMLHARRRQLKPLLLDQHFIAGLGNIYVDETLWEARIHPARRSDSLTDDEVARLHAAIVDVLRAAVRGRGTTLRDYRGADNLPGDYQRALAVYGREGHPCRRCGHAIERIVIGNRGTRLCPICQALPDGA